MATAADAPPAAPAEQAPATTPVAALSEAGESANASAPAANPMHAAPKASKAAKGSKAPKPAKAAKGDDAAASGNGGPSVAAHPRAARAVARAKGWGGLLGFVLGGYLSLPTNTVAAAGVRALLAGVVCYVAVWAGAVFLWRRLVMLEIKGREQQLWAAQTGGGRRELPPGPAERPGASALS